MGKLQLKLFARMLCNHCSKHSSDKKKVLPLKSNNVTQLALLQLLLQLRLLNPDYRSVAKKFGCKNQPLPCQSFSKNSGCQNLSHCFWQFIGFHANVS
mmetsp:Transcript_30506/g.71985  ORF Transcript_30506/g.71985 Transcript_30506/m.71985 type:complete len:98 (-) Transcript_30506:513-806(-)